MAKTKRAAVADELIPYTPETWMAAQLHAHRADTMDGAFHAASCLAAGWYRRAVTIDYQVTKDNDERYMVRPSDVPVLAGWTAVYEVRAVQS